MGPRAALVVLAGFVGGCAAHVAPSVPPAPALPAPAPLTHATLVYGSPVTLPIYVADTRAVDVEKALAAGKSELALGHLTAARENFDHAVDLLLAAPNGARQNPVLAPLYERVLDQITALEATALREGDGFTESRSEPAMIDALLGAETPDKAPAISTAEKVSTDLASTPHDLPIPVNNKVLSYVELFQGSLRAFMEQSLARGSRYVPMIQDVFRSEGLPLDLAYIPIVESAFQPTALSRATAKGLWQFMLATGRENGLAQDWFIDDRSDPVKATHAAAQYLKSLLDNFGGDWSLALASYNVGPGYIQRAMQRAKVSDYWKLSSTTKYLPRETREYVPMIFAAIIIAKNPSLYGFDIDAMAPLTYEYVTVPDALDLRLIAEWTGVSIDEIRGLNPELRRSTTPVGTHELRVPIGTAAAVESHLAIADPGLFVKFNTYTVKSGDTLAGVARALKVKTADLAQANHLKTTAKLMAGQSLMIPRDPVATAALSTKPAVPAPTPATVPAVPSAALATKLVAPPAQVPATYKVKSGDTLSSIARQFSTTVDSLRRLNQLSGDAIVSGATLIIRK